MDMGRRTQGTDITLRGDHTGEFSRGLVYQGLVKALETGVSLCRSPFGNLGSPLTGNFRHSCRALEREHLSLRELC